MANTTDMPTPWRPTLAFFAWLVPGLGHLLDGQTRRGVVLCISIFLLWLSGLLIGGIGVIDRHQHRFWFIGQVCLGPAIAMDYLTQKVKITDHARAYAGEPPICQPSFAHVNEQGVLLTALAGLLNLLAIFDVMYRSPRAETSGAKSQQSQPS